MQTIFQAFGWQLIGVMLIMASDPALPDVAASNVIPQISVPVSHSLPYYPVIIQGHEFPSLLGASVARIRAIARHGKALEAIPFQIDKRDPNGHFELSSNDVGVLDSKDECVFMTADAGERISPLTEHFAQQRVVEIAIVDAKNGERKWVYLLETTADQKWVAASKDYVVYDATKDVIETDSYKIGFSTPLPFLIDKLQWRTGEANKWSPNLVDTMKIRHEGKFFGNIDFSRTQADYQSRVVAVKDGPARVIRRTLNSVRVIGYLQSPSLTIDYVTYANGFQMDTTIDFPFPLSWFFSDLDMFTTIDWNDDPSLPALRIYGADARNGIPINGHMTEEKARFNTSEGRLLAIESFYGLMFVQMEIDKNLPVSVRTYLQDDRSLADPPERIPGQFGNVGFVTSGWEKVDTSVHHLLINVLLVQKATVEQGMGMLGHYPWRRTQALKQ